MEIRVSAIFAAFGAGGLVREIRGPDLVLSGVAGAEDCGPGDLVFVDAEEYVATAIAGGASAVVTTAELAAAFAGRESVALLIAPNVKLARALVTQRFFDRDLRPAGVAAIHPRAIVHPAAVVASSARIGPGAVVEARARIGERCVLLANVVVEEDAVLGDGTVVHPGAILGYRCEIGRDAIVKAGAVIGSEGFGFAQDRQRKNHRIPQLGRVVLGDRVVIGANCCIDRAPYGETRIGNGTVMDNLCEIAHGVQVGEDCIFTPMLCVAGSTRIGDRVLTSGPTAITDHVEIASDVTLLHKAGVTGDVRTPGPHAGLPLMPLKDHMKRQAILRRLPEMRDQLRQLERRIAALEAETS